MTKDLLAYGLLGKALKKELFGKSGESLSCIKEATASVISRELPRCLSLPWLEPGEGLPRLDF